MSPILRLLILPFLILFTFCARVVLLALFEEFGIFETTLSELRFLNYLGEIGSLI